MHRSVGSGWCRSAVGCWCRGVCIVRLVDGRFVNVGETRSARGWVEIVVIFILIVSLSAGTAGAHYFDVVIVFVLLVVVVVFVVIVSRATEVDCILVVGVSCGGHALVRGMLKLLLRLLPAATSHGRPLLQDGMAGRGGLELELVCPSPQDTRGTHGTTLTDTRHSHSPPKQPQQPPPANANTNAKQHRDCSAFIFD